ncbi:uncharacterized protein EI97DRAFT_292243 [Westerdykella ornata]|uniref:Uncharacterized protein n=1 Tax=Westerdykella ornata TaxID=318751 RepID=A0A6A6JNE9_WESOR|nr:uncharacterized protein EI97DRAFT_292243 [Westerdykella ornata]KAF2277448.1 hypothetical protein EI97DRAFT_292243 [Westerdykella ornata]
MYSACVFEGLLDMDMRHSHGPSLHHRYQCLLRVGACKTTSRLELNPFCCQSPRPTLILGTSLHGFTKASTSAKFPVQFLGSLFFRLRCCWRLPITSLFRCHSASSCCCAPMLQPYHACRCHQRHGASESRRCRQAVKSLKRSTAKPVESERTYFAVIIPRPLRYKRMLRLGKTPVHISFKVHSPGVPHPNVVHYASSPATRAGLQPERVIDCGAICSSLQLLSC